MKDYDPMEYWLERGKTYQARFEYDESKKLQENFLIDLLSEFQPFTSVLEAGCGFGRITKLILSNFPRIRQYVAVDLSPHQIEAAKEYLRDELTSKTLDMKFVVSDLQSLQLSNSKYDLVIACEMLLHVLPSEIVQVIGMLVGFSRKYVVNVDRSDHPPWLASHNFIHDYEKIYQAIPSVRNVICIPISKRGILRKVDTKQSIYCAELSE